MTTHQLADYLRAMEDKPIKFWSVSEDEGTEMSDTFHVELSDNHKEVEFYPW